MHPHRRPYQNQPHAGKSRHSQKSSAIQATLASCTTWPDYRNFTYDITQFCVTTMVMENRLVISIFTPALHGVDTHMQATLRRDHVRVPHSSKAVRASGGWCDGHAPMRIPPACPNRW